MALIDCPECGNEVSTKAVACPSCAFPVGKRGGPAHGVLRPREPARSVTGMVASGLEVTKQIVSRLAISGVLLASGAAWEAPPVVLVSFLIAGSTVPIWVRARRAERLGVGGGLGAVEGRVEQRIAELEERYSQQLADVEDASQRQIAELEERLDFTERLLTRERGKEA